MNPNGPEENLRFSPKDLEEQTLQEFSKPQLKAFGFLITCRVIPHPVFGYLTFI